jgi:hypothetical protein
MPTLPVDRAFGLYYESLKLTCTLSEFYYLKFLLTIEGYVILLVSLGYASYYMNKGNMFKKPGWRGDEF